MARIRLPQGSETETASVESGIGRYQYSYSRSAEARENGEAGQDYLTIIEEKEYLAFALCDGISMSYYGDIAASFLGESLLDWLISEDSALMDASRLRESLHGYLIGQAQEADKKLQRHQIPSHIKGILREVLLAKKEMGSSTIYCCGKIEWPSSNNADGRLLLAWQGDTRIRIWENGVEQQGLLGDSFHTSERWSTKSGPVGGSPHIHVGSLPCSRSGSGAVLAYSDGLKGLDASSRITKDKITDIIAHEAADPSSDDMSIIHIQWQTP
ncbi:hypothetical protein D3P09_16675 [Paenibacillus pinisoli]|uniref:PPM-type phosphatase domain-containing protein n=1 Tax=Paenibacillus pinisoli TaxID=1276110 RepID=A0A3A6PHB3_9BACL|nr:hypothetical protein [Paenibacillus pinisoli]RJX39126.1 hypothetical protein D3P09_16675 [Paenibacillus pinisoli]